MQDSSIVPPDVDGRVISTLLDFQMLQKQTWQPEELADILRHQLAAPLYLSLGNFSAEVAQLVHQSTPALDPLVSMKQLLHMPQPPVLLLRLVKRFSKHCLSNPNNPLPAGIVMLLYYAAIGIARTRSGQVISDLPAVELQRGLRWVSNQAWIDEETRVLLRETLKRLEEDKTPYSSTVDAAAE